MVVHDILLDIMDNELYRVELFSLILCIVLAYISKSKKNKKIYKLIILIISTVFMIISAAMSVDVILSGARISPSIIYTFIWLIILVVTLLQIFTYSDKHD